jgi:ornithine carbamoyltransferase
MIGCNNVGMDVSVVCPDHPKYCPSSETLKKIKEHSGGKVEVSHEPSKGVTGADVIYTDVWISAGMEEESKMRMEAFPPFQVDMDLIKKAKKDCIVMHCLPAHRGYEITDEVIDSPQSVVFEQAGNRMHAQNGLLHWLLK